jgi:FADH2 O2-dependent halogenase
MTHHQSDVFDVAVLGSGLVGTILSACLARNGVRVVLIDPGTHPRFVIGEGEHTPPYTLMVLRLIGERYGVPEVKHLASFEATQTFVTTNGGVCRNVSYVYHREGRSQHPREAHMLRPPTVGFTQHHLFRQDTDAWMLNVAAKYGVEVRQQQRVTDVDANEGSVTVTCEGRPAVMAKYLVDTTGPESVLAERFGVRQQPGRFRHQARTLANHLLDVRPFDEIAPASRYGNPSPWHQGSLHHVFDGGFMWATTPACGVGLRLDPRVHPEPDCSPDEEFRRFVARFPDLARQFESARPVQEWVRTGPTQHSTAWTVGTRWCLLGNAAGAVDPLFCTDLTVGLEAVNALTHRLLDAVRRDSFTNDRFEPVQELVQGLLDWHDDLCANAFVAFRDFALWDVWWRVWHTRQIMSTYEINRRYAKYLGSRDTEELAFLEQPWWCGRKLPGDGPYAPAMRFFQEANERLQAVERGEEDPARAAADLMRLLGEEEFTPPVFGMHKPGHQWTVLPTHKMAETVRWSRRTPPKDIGKLTLEGLLLFARARFGRGESLPKEELRHAAATWPVVGERLRLRAPR